MSLSQPSFSPRRRWSIGLNVFLVVLLVLGVVVMLNYLSKDHFLRVTVNEHSKPELSALTVKVIQSITNPVRITLFYDKEHEPLYGTVSELLEQYSLMNPRISVQTVDYLRDPGLAQKVKTEYKLGAATDKNLVIFDCGARQFNVDGNALTHYAYEQLPKVGEPEFRKLTFFEGEKNFTSALLAVTSSKPLLACVLQQHGEHDLTSGSDLGYAKFASELLENSISVRQLPALLGENSVPTNCDLLIVPGPTTELQEIELDRIDQYLGQGGRLLVLLRASSLNKDTGLDKLLARWGVDVGHNVIQDPDNSVLGAFDVVIRDFNKKHPMVNPLLDSGHLYLISPRSISQRKVAVQAADAPQVQELAFTGPKSTQGGAPPAHPFPVIAAVEKGAIKNVITQRGSTRIVVVGDSLFLANGTIDSVENRAFVGYAANWLLERTELLQGLPPRPLNEVLMTRIQMQTAQWVLLAGMPGGVLLLGSLVWLRRRH